VLDGMKLLGHIMFEALSSVKNLSRLCVYSDHMTSCAMSTQVLSGAVSP